MVFLHGLETGNTPPRRTADLDVVVNARALSTRPRAFADRLISLGYELDGISRTGIGHRFVREGIRIDVLLPDGIGERSHDVIQPGARSVEVPGGTQALARSAQIEVNTGTATGLVWRPNLLGAILVKARAVEVDDLPDAQREDLAFLLSLVPNPFAMAEEVSSKERRWLKQRCELLDSDAPAWRLVDQAEDGRSALAILSGASR